MPQDRKSTFEPQVVRKLQKDISEIDQKIISMYAKGMTTRQISEMLMDIYGFEASEGFISDVTDKLAAGDRRMAEKAVKRCVSGGFHRRDLLFRPGQQHHSETGRLCHPGNRMRRKERSAFHTGGRKRECEVLAIRIERTENRGVKDILILCADGLTGIKDAIAAAYPQTEYQRCIVHQVRNTLKYVLDKDRKAFAKDLKTIYNAPTEKEGREALDTVTAAWEEKYPRAMKRW